MSRSSGFGVSSGEASRGSRAMPHSGHSPGASRSTSGCIGQVQTARRPAPSGGAAFAAGGSPTKRPRQPAEQK